MLDYATISENSGDIINNSTRVKAERISRVIVENIAGQGRKSSGEERIQGVKESRGRVVGDGLAVEYRSQMLDCRSENVRAGDGRGLTGVRRLVE